jgi:flagellin-like protein
MRKLFKSRKALSPVVAAIILIAVTVAVSIAVAAWMGALTFTFMKTEELKILSGTWNGTTYIDLKVRNTGSASLTMTGVQVNNGNPTAYDLDTGTAGNQTTNVSIAAGGEKTIRIWHSYTSGVKYEFAILTSSGNKYTYVSTAP